MISLSEEYRPRHWDDVIGQEKIRAKIDGLRKRGLSGRAFWISGSSGTGKTTIARLLADELSDPYAIAEVDAGALTASAVREYADTWRVRPLGRGIWSLIINEAHGLRRDVIRALLVALDPVPDNVVVVFTTTSEAQDVLFEEQIDANPLLSRCTRLELSRRNITEPMAARLKLIAETEGLDGQPVERYVRLLQTYRNNMRACFQAIEAGEMVASD